MTLPRGRLHSVGAPGNGTLYCGFYDRPDTGNYADFLTKAYGGYGKFAIFPDNVSYHKSRRWGGGFTERLGGGSGHATFRRAPELNLVGVQWVSFGKAAGNRLHEGAEETRESVNAMLREEEVPVVKTYNCLAR